jgi:hypothetical protein
VKLTEPELLAKSDELASAVEELASLEGEKKINAKHFGDEIKETKSSIGSLAFDIRNKTELRDVPCSEVPDYKLGTMAIVRDDTRETVEHRTMSEDERQHKLELLDKRRVGEEN